MLKLHANRMTYLYGIPRMGYWFQGCSFEPKCECCFNQELQNSNDYKISFDSGYKMYEKTIKEIDQSHDIKGIMLSGGEPLDQWNEGLDKFIVTIRSSMDILLFTGHIIEEVDKIINDHWHKYFDIVVSGRFDKNKILQPPLLGLLGSLNQKIYSVYNYSFDNFGAKEIEINENGDTSIGGCI